MKDDPSKNETILRNVVASHLVLARNDDVIKMAYLVTFLY